MLWGVTLRGQRTTSASQSPLLLWGSKGSNLGHEQAELLLAEPSLSLSEFSVSGFLP